MEKWSFLDLGTSWGREVRFTLLKGPCYPLDSRLGEPQSRSERYGKVKILDLKGT
jgi:hypothetical protein